MADDIVVRGRVFFFSQRCYHPETHEKLIDETIIKNGVAHKSIKRYAYVLHDNDYYIEEDVNKWCSRNGKDESECPFKVGDKKDAHYHIALDCPSNVDIECIAKWFNTPSSMIDIPKGRDAFEDCTEYETHEKCPEKTLYEDKRIKANFDFRKVLNDREENKAKFGKNSPSIYEKMLYAVRFDGKRLVDVQDMDRLVYAKNEHTLKRLRNEYLASCKPPEKRINYYVCGKGGVGKGTLCRSLARSLFPQYEYDDEIFFEIGASNATFENYDGQPVIIWNDFRAYDLLNALGGRGNVFDVFDTMPTQRKQNIKYGSLTLLNSVNLVNSAQGYEDFLKGLSGEYTDKHGNTYKTEDYKQSGRRFPVIIPIYENHFEMYLNNGWLENNGDFTSYKNAMSLHISLQNVAKIGLENPSLVKKMDEMLYSKLKPELDKLKITEDDIRNKFSDDELKALMGMNDNMDVINKGFNLSGYEDATDCDEIPFV